MDLIVRTKHAARKLALCIKAVEGTGKAARRPSTTDGETARGTGRWGGSTADKITTLALQLLLVICVWGPNAQDHVSSSHPPGPPSSPGIAARTSSPTPHGYR